PPRARADAGDGGRRSGVLRRRRARERARGRGFPERRAGRRVVATQRGRAAIAMVFTPRRSGAPCAHLDSHRIYTVDTMAIAARFAGDTTRLRAHDATRLRERPA